MSTNFTYWFNSPQSFPVLAKNINRVLGCNLQSLSANESNMFCKFMSLELYFGDNLNYENDRDLDFENYQYNLDITIFFADNDLLCIALSTLSIIAYILLARLKITDGMLVYDTQILLAKYKYDSDLGIINILSGQPIEYPQHFIDLEKRLEIL